MSGSVSARFIIASMASRFDEPICLELAELMVRQWLSDAFAKSPTTKFLLRTMPDDAAEDIEILLRRVDQTIEPGAGDQLAAALRFLLHTQIQHDLAHTIEQEIYENGLVQARATIPLDK